MITLTTSSTTLLFTCISIVIIYWFTIITTTMAIGLESLPSSLNGDWSCRLRKMFHLKVNYNDCRMVTIILLSKICFPNSSFTSDVTFERIISRWSTTYNKLTHFIGHDGLKVVGTHVDSSTFCNLVTISTSFMWIFFHLATHVNLFPLKVHVPWHLPL